MRLKAHTFEVESAKEAAKNFQSLLGKLVKVPKSEVEHKRKRRRKLTRRKKQ